MRRATVATVLSAGTVAVFGAASAAGDSIVLVSASAKSDPTCATASKTHAFKTIAAALACSGVGGTVSIGAGTFAGGFTVPSSVRIEGAGANKIATSDATPLTVPEVTIAPGADVHLETLTVSGGAGGNAGIAAGSGALSLVNVTVDEQTPRPRRRRRQ